MDRFTFVLFPITITLFGLFNAKEHIMRFKKGRHYSAFVFANFVLAVFSREVLS